LTAASRRARVAVRGVIVAAVAAVMMMMQMIATPMKKKGVPLAPAL
jgi:hypothetical protein